MLAEVAGPCGAVPWLTQGRSTANCGVVGAGEVYSTNMENWSTTGGESRATILRFGIVIRVWLEA